jgi:hypothetical protein
MEFLINVFPEFEACEVVAVLQKDHESLGKIFSGRGHCIGSAKLKGMASRAKSSIGELLMKGLV